MNKEDKSNMIADYIAKAIVAVIIGVTIALLVSLCSCVRTVYVPVKEVQTVYQNHTDTVHQTDSIIKETERIVMQLDSEAMAKFGIQISNAEKAWLVREKEFERRIKELLEKKADTIMVHDSIAVPYPVEKPLSTMQSIWIKLGKMFSGVGFCAIFLVIVYIFAIKRK